MACSGPQLAVKTHTHRPSRVRVVPRSCSGIGQQCSARTRSQDQTHDSPGLALTLLLDKPLGISPKPSLCFKVSCRTGTWQRASDPRLPTTVSRESPWPNGRLRFACLCLGRPLNRPLKSRERSRRVRHAVWLAFA